MQVITISGNIGRDAELRSTGQGDSVCGFPVAVNNGKETTWYDCSIWGKRGKSVAEYLKKGVTFSGVGGFSMREHEGKTYLKVNVNEFSFSGGNRNAGQSNDSNGSQGQSQTQDHGFDNSDVPF